MKQFEVDREKSMAYKANGRLKPANQREKASTKLSLKRFSCPECHTTEEVEGAKISFGEAQRCGRCGVVMLEMLD